MSLPEATLPTPAARRLALGEVYVLCSDCGARLWSDDARENELCDRAIACPYRVNGRCAP